MISPPHPEAGRDHLLLALAALPVHAPGEGAWPAIARELPLAQAVDALPAHSPTEEVWSGICHQLQQAAPLPVAVAQLPVHTPDDALWQAIATHLPASTPPAPRRWWLRVSARRRVLALLALLVVGGISWWQRTQSPVATGPRETISYGSEVVTELPAALYPAPAPDALGSQGRAFIEAHCSSLPTVCQSTRFRELRGQLEALTTEETQLAKDIQHFGSQPELLRHQGRVATQKAATTRELIDLLIS